MGTYVAKECGSIDIYLLAVFGRDGYTDESKNVSLKQHCFCMLFVSSF
jgi:hypothetical protein